MHRSLLTRGCRAATVFLAAAALLGASMVPANAAGVPTSLATESSAGIAQQSEVQLSASDIAYMTDSSARLGIAPDVRDRIIDNLKHGILPMSATSANAVETKTTESPGQSVVRKVFADGSVAVTTYELPTEDGLLEASGQPVLRSIRNCYDQTGVGTFPFAHCQVRTDQVTWTLAFEADGQLGTNCQFPARISRIYGSWYSGVGAASSPTQEILQSTQSCSGAPARARSTTNVTVGLYTFSASLTLWVNNTSRWDTSP